MELMHQKWSDTESFLYAGSEKRHCEVKNTGFLLTVMSGLSEGTSFLLQIIQQWGISDDRFIHHQPEQQVQVLLQGWPCSWFHDRCFSFSVSGQLLICILFPRVVRKLKREGSVDPSSTGLAETVLVHRSALTFC